VNEMAHFSFTWPLVKEIWPIQTRLRPISIADPATTCEKYDPFVDPPTRGDTFDIGNATALWCRCRPCGPAHLFSLQSSSSHVCVDGESDSEGRGGDATTVETEEGGDGAGVQAGVPSPHVGWQRRPRSS
jgi:hypothetical protein